MQLARKDAGLVPSLILFGMLFGHWWRSVIPTATVGWPLLLVATGTTTFGTGLLIGAGLAFLNTSVGVVINRGVVWMGRRVQRRSRSSPDAS